MTFKTLGAHYDLGHNVLVPSNYDPIIIQFAFKSFCVHIIKNFRRESANLSPD